MLRALVSDVSDHDKYVDGYVLCAENMQRLFPGLIQISTRKLDNGKGQFTLERLDVAGPPIARIPTY